MMNDESNEEKINNIKENRKAILAIIFYVIMLFLVSSLVLIILIVTYSNTHSNITYEKLLECCTKNSVDGFAKEYVDAKNLLLSMSNLIVYGITGIVFVLVFKKVLFEDLIKITKRPKFYALFIPLAIVIFYALTLIIDTLVSKITPATNNQSTIELMLKSDGKVYTILMVCILAPLIEELVYRYSIFKLTKKIHIVLAYAISIIAFTLPHVISTDINEVGIGNWLIQTIPYASSGLLFAIMYHASGFNIYVTITAHMFNNTLAVLKILN